MPANRENIQSLLCHLLDNSGHAHPFALFEANGDLVQANANFHQLCFLPHRLEPKINLFRDFALGPETLEKLAENHFATCLALYTPCSLVHEEPPPCYRLEITLIPFPGQSRIAALAQPLSAKQKGVMLMENLDTYQFITDKLEDIVFLQDENFCIFYINESISRLLGWNQQDLMHQEAFSLYHPEDREKVAEAMQTLKESSQEIVFEVRMRHHDSYYLWVESRTRMFSYDTKRVIMSINRDISQRKQTEEQIKFMTFHDSLTGLFNRNYFEQEMRRVAESRYSKAGLIICDVDCLKFINDTLGHKSGDTLIQAAGATLLSSFRVSDMVARIGGDEFAVLLPDASQKDLDQAVKRIQKNMRRFSRQNPEFPLHMSIGFSLADEPPFDMQALFKQADDAMYQNKLYSKRMHKSDAFHILMTILKKREPDTEKRRAQLESILQEMSNSLKISDQDRDFLLLFAKVYNIGLLGVPQEIVAKDSSLSPEERQTLRQQAETAYRIAQHTSELQPIADWIYKQHEWWNGQGYPTGTSGEDIPLPSRIMAVARAYTAMTTSRPYRPAKSHAQALAELQKGAGTQFDPQLVQTFIRKHPNGPDEQFDTSL